MTRDEAIAQLEALAPLGVLKIITNEHNCGAGKHPDIPPFDPVVCEAFCLEPVSLDGKVFNGSVRDPRHFVIHTVTVVSPARGAPGLSGQYVAYSAEGDYCQGQPEALLARLTEANKV